MQYRYGLFDFFDELISVSAQLRSIKLVCSTFGFTRQNISAFSLEALNTEYGFRSVSVVLLFNLCPIIHSRLKSIGKTGKEMLQ